jgi:hypothetical protein
MLKRFLVRIQQVLCRHSSICTVVPYRFDKPQHLYLVKGKCQDCKKRVRVDIFYDPKRK